MRLCCVCLDVFPSDADTRFQRIALPPTDVPDLSRLIGPLFVGGSAFSCSPCQRLLNNSKLTDLRQLRGEGIQRVADAGHMPGPSQDGLAIIAELSYVGWWRANKDRKVKYGRGALALFEMFRRYQADPAGDDRPLRYETRASGSARISISALGNVLIIIDLWTKEHGQGEGGRFLRETLAICDEIGATAGGTVEAHGSDGMDSAALLSWYKRLGFVEDSVRDGLVRVTRAPAKNRSITDAVRL